jgi:hypothetical protein
MTVPPDELRGKGAATNKVEADRFAGLRQNPA